MLLPTDLENIIIEYRLNLYYKEKYDVVMTEMIFKSKIRFYREVFWLWYYKYFAITLMFLYTMLILYLVGYVIYHAPKDMKYNRKYFIGLDGEIYYYNY